MTVKELATNAKAAAPYLAVCSTQQKNDLLLCIAEKLVQHQELILQANAQDLKNAKDAGIKATMCDRLMLNEQRIRALASSVREIVDLADPIGTVLYETKRPNGLKIQKISVPMGLIGIIYEARPNVTVDAAALCIKAGSAVILRGGKEAIHSNQALVKIMRSALAQCNMPEDCICLIEDTSRDSSYALMRMHGIVDLLIPRGGAGLIRSVVENATVPVIETGVGNCHIYVDEAADVDMAAQIIFNAKCSRPSVCNACETVLVHEKIAEQTLPTIAQALDQNQVELRGCEKTCSILGDRACRAQETDYQTEFLDYILAVKVVASIDDAIQHIRTYSTGHSESIITQDQTQADYFVARIDSAAVYVNASTRFTDGGEFGFGAEIGISTQKLHARGPMGLQEMASYKYVICGNGQVR